MIDTRKFSIPLGLLEAKHVVPLDEPSEVPRGERLGLRPGHHGRGIWVEREEERIPEIEKDTKQRSV